MSTSDESSNNYFSNRSSSATSATTTTRSLLASERPKKRAGRRIFKETRHPVYRGVRLRNKNKWVCEMRVPDNNKLRIWLGTHDTPEMAARAHDVAAIAFRGKSACLNFADSAWRLPLPASTDAVEIRRAAMEAAEMFSNKNREIITVQVSNNDDQVGDEIEQDGMYVERVFPADFEDFKDLLMSMSDEPIMSPPPSPSTTYHGIACYDDVEIFDPQFSLWDF